VWWPFAPARAGSQDQLEPRRQIFSGNGRGEGNVQGTRLGKQAAATNAKINSAAIAKTTAETTSNQPQSLAVRTPP
jgi:hypothetical protein